MNVHIFDGQLLNTKAFISTHLSIASAVSNEDKLLSFERLRSQLRPNPNINTIINDFIVYGHENGPNYDPSNDLYLYADDLLYICAELVQKLPQNETLKFLLNEQFIHMSTGMCPQGRTHRLFQIVLAFIE
ncbi:hypothetical protein BH23THE1_BH23THE1_34160 [soil metagenome]